MWNVPPVHFRSVDFFFHFYFNVFYYGSKRLLNDYLDILRPFLPERFYLDRKFYRRNDVWERLGWGQLQWDGVDMGTVSMGMGWGCG